MGLWELAKNSYTMTVAITVSNKYCFISYLGILCLLLESVKLMVVLHISLQVGQKSHSLHYS